MKALLHHEAYEDILTEATESLAKSDASPDDRWFAHYYRGCSRWRLGQLEEAADDMKADLDDAPSHADRYPGPQWFLDIIARQQAARPSHRKDVTLADFGVLFSVFYERDDLALHELLDLLPVAVNSVKRLTGSPPRRTTILLFESAESMQAYEDIPRPTPPINESILAYGGLSGVDICISRAPNTFVVDPRGSFFRMTITHEYTHVVVGRLLEGRPGLPRWLSEGIANVAGGYSAPDQMGEFARRFQTALSHDAVLTLDQLNSRAFYGIANQQFAGSRFEDPYAQATSMATFLLLGRPPTIFADLITALRRTDSFPTAFRQTFGESPEECYADWKAYAVH